MKLDKDQIKALSAITADAGQVFFATTIVPFLLGIDKMKLSVVLSGLALTLACWIASIVLAKGKQR